MRRAESRSKNLGSAFPIARLCILLINRARPAPYNPRAFGKTPASARWMMRRTHSFGGPALFLLVVVLQLAAARSAAGQSTATLQGTITDSQGAVMPGVTVSIKNQATA